MTVLGDKMKEALANKVDYSKFVWKGAKRLINNKYVQEEIKLIDATPEQLQSFYNYCYTMLTNTDKQKPGRLPLLKIIQKQREKCNAALFIKYLAMGDPSLNWKPYPTFLYLQDLNTLLNNNSEVLPSSEWDTTPIKVTMANVPAEFSNISIRLVLDACLDQLGIFDKKHITLSFISRLGIWFTNQELKDLVVKDENGKIINRLDIVRERCNIPKEIKLHVNSDGGLSYKEFRAMMNLKSKKYNDLTMDQLRILRDKVLFKLEESVQSHAAQWKTRMDNICEVAEYRKIPLETKSLE